MEIWGKTKDWASYLGELPHALSYEFLDDIFEVVSKSTCQTSLFRIQYLSLFSNIILQATHANKLK